MQNYLEATHQEGYSVYIVFCGMSLLTSEGLMQSDLTAIWDHPNGFIGYSW